MDGFVEMLRSWQNFYFMTGGAAGGLVGLIFVTMSLGMPLVTGETHARIRDNIKHFVTPSIFYFVSVLLLSCMMLVPTYEPNGLAAVLLVGGLVGFVRTLPYARALYQTAAQYQDFTIEDWLAQIIGPLGSYALLVVAAVSFVVNQWSVGFLGIWAADIALLLCAIANTWSVVIWIIEKGGKQS